MNGGNGVGTGFSADARKAAIREALQELARIAEVAGLTSAARDIRETRIPKLDGERFSLVVLGEFNHGKSTFVNALLGEPALPTGITPTTAVLTHVSWGAERSAEVAFESGQRKAVPLHELASWLTVEAVAARGETGVHHVEVRHPTELLRGNLTLVDTPGVNDLNEQRADITYGYVPRADAAIFLLDATQILTASERQFLEERILRTSRERLIFVLAKADLLDAGELEETLRFARLHLGRIVPEPAVFPVSARRALAGDRESSGMAPFLAHLGTTLGDERRRLLLDHALGDAGRLASFVRQSLGMRRRSLELPVEDLEQRIARARERLTNGKKALDQAARTVQAETAALRARVRQDLADFAADFRAALPAEIDAVEAPDVRRFLAPFIQDTWKQWAEAEGERIAAELERLAEQVIQVANENVHEVTAAVAGDLGIGAELQVQVDTLKYDVSVFALGALGTTVFLFVNTVVGGLLTLAAPILAVVLRARIANEIKVEAKQRGASAIDQAAGMLGPKMDEVVDGFGARLLEFVAQAGEALARGIAEVLDRALAERRAREAEGAAAASTVDPVLLDLKKVEESLAEIRQRVWQD